MSRETFHDIGEGKDAIEAFDKIVDHAQYVHRHRGYTGTIAEKSDFRLCIPPKGISPEQACCWIQDGCAESVPKEFWEWVVAAKAVYDDKWGLAVCVELEHERGKPRRFAFLGRAPS